MHLVDVHTHLDHPRFKEDLPEVLSRAKSAGVVAIITQGLTNETNLALLELARADPVIKVAFGLYPSFALGVRSDLLPEEDVMRSRIPVDETLRVIEAHKDHILAIGEVGLDFKESADPEARALQVEIFRKVVRLAKRLGKPLSVHTRGAEKEVLDILEEERFSHACMHCFMGSRKLVERGAKLGLMFSVPSSIVRSEQFQLMVRTLPMGCILTETDAPYLAPVKEARNEPATVREAVIKIAEIKGLTPEDCADAIYHNYQKMFL